MKLTFLGTSSANAYPEAFCKCANCEQARVLGGPNLRKRSAALINDDLLIDLGPDIMSASMMHSISLTNVQYCLQTHSHADHLDISHILSRSPEFGIVGAPKLHIYASQFTLDKMAQTFIRDLSSESLLDKEVRNSLNMDIHPIEEFVPIAVGPYIVTPFPANHGHGAYLYAIRTNDRSIFYGTDTAVFPDKTWEGLLNQKIQFDLVVLDHTYGPDVIGTDHLNAHQVIEHAQRMHKEGLIADDGRVFATHISHDANPSHEILVEYAAQNNYEIAYDGLEIQL